MKHHKNVHKPVPSRGHPTKIRVFTPGQTWQCATDTPRVNPWVVDTLPRIDRQPGETWPTWAARDRQRVCAAIIRHRAQVHAMRWAGAGVG